MCGVMFSSQEKVLGANMGFQIDNFGLFVKMDGTCHFLQNEQIVFLEAHLFWSVFKCGWNGLTGF